MPACLPQLDSWLTGCAAPRAPPPPLLLRLVQSKPFFDIPHRYSGMCMGAWAL